MANCKQLLPCDKCGGQCCNLAPFTPKEHEKLKSKLGEDAEVTPLYSPDKQVMGFIISSDSTGKCYFLENGRCKIYASRPEICRILGTKKLPCPYSTTNKGTNK